jgi:hypothetical protein
MSVKKVLCSNEDVVVGNNDSVRTFTLGHVRLEHRIKAHTLISTLYFDQIKAATITNSSGLKGGRVDINRVQIVGIHNCSQLSIFVLREYRKWKSTPLIDILAGLVVLSRAMNSRTLATKGRTFKVSRPGDDSIRKQLREEILLLRAEIGATDATSAS